MKIRRNKQQTLIDIQSVDYYSEIYCCVAGIILIISIIVAAKSNIIVQDNIYNIYYQKPSNNPQQSRSYKTRSLKSSSYDELLLNAKLYQDLYGAWKHSNDKTYSHWTQQVGDTTRWLGRITFRLLQSLQSLYLFA